MKTFGLRSERVVLPEGVRPATLVIEGELIADILDYAAGPEDLRDVGDRVLGPGLVDCHVHMNEPGRTHWEGFETATRAAAAGGVTTLVDMPLNSIPVTTTRAAFEEKLSASREQCFVDVGFWGGVIPHNQLDLPKLAEAGVLGCKAFLVHSGIDEFPNATEADLRLAMPILRAHGLPLLAHAELDLGAPSPATNPQAYASYLASRPREWEDAAIRLLVKLSRETGCAVHIVHLSSHTAVPILRRAKEEGLPITVETCPHYLCLEAEGIPNGATHFKCAPPIRDHENREALWSALFEGVIDFIITDHSPCTPELKLRERGDFAEAWGGIASLQLGLSTVWTEARRRGADLPRLFRWLSEKPALFAGMAGKKGRIARGYDADLVLWDPDIASRVEAERLFFKHKISPYLGQDLFGRVEQTWLRGASVYDGTRHSERALGQALLHRRNAA